MTEAGESESAADEVSAIKAGALAARIPTDYHADGPNATGGHP